MSNFVFISGTFFYFLHKKVCKFRENRDVSTSFEMKNQMQMKSAKFNQGLKAKTVDESCYDYESLNGEFLNEAYYHR